MGGLYIDEEIELIRSIRSALKASEDIRVHDIFVSIQRVQDLRDYDLTPDDQLILRHDGSSIMPSGVVKRSTFGVNYITVGDSLKESGEIAREIEYQLSNLAKRPNHIRSAEVIAGAQRVTSDDSSTTCYNIIIAIEIVAKKV